MRIISGKFKGKKILQPINEHTRPLKDLTKESIFNIITHSNLFNVKINKSNNLDLFSGVGSFGLECISRGASHVDFFENYPDTLKILKTNINNLNCNKITQVWPIDTFDQKSIKSLKNTYEIVFIDPPYKEKKTSNLVEEILKLNILKKNGIIIIHRHKNENEEFTKKFNILVQRKYGISKIIFGN